MLFNQARKRGRGVWPYCPFVFIDTFIPQLFIAFKRLKNLNGREVEKRLGTIKLLLVPKILLKKSWAAG